MTTGGSPRESRGTPEQPPSARAQSSLSEDLRHEVAEARTRLEEASLRAEAHRLLGDEDGVARAMADQERVVEELEDRLGRVVSAAVLQRDAEQVLADVTAAAPRPEPTSAPRLDDAPAEVVGPSTPRRRAPVLSGAASLVALVGVAAAAVFGVVRGIDRVEVAEVAAGAPTTEADAPAGPDDAAAASPLVPLPPSITPRPTGGASPTTSAAATPTADPDDAPSPSAAASPDADETPTPDDAPDFEDVVQQLVDAVAGLGGDRDPDPDDTELPSEDVDATLPDAADVVESLDPRPDQDPPSPADDTGGDDGFVPDGPAQ